LFNELYFVSDGGSVWLEVDDVTDQPSNDNAGSKILRDYGRFAYLEGHEYRMYNTYDVHHYASFALVMLWPKLQLSLQYDIAAAIPHEDTRHIRFCMSGEVDVVKKADCVPHDVGDPEDEPWIRTNAYFVHPTHEWKDLNTKFVMQVYRDYVVTGDEQYLQEMYPLAKTILKKSLRWDTDGDGVIDNAGFADQTYDAWIVTGASVYCGGMWLAALRMFCEMATILEQPDDCLYFRSILDKGMASFERKLWNGKYYNYDSSGSGHHDSIMADQLAGHWFLRASKIPDYVFPKEHVDSCLRTIFEHNVVPFDGGRMGAINGMRPDGSKDVTSCQSDEFWTGVSYAVAAEMIQEGMIDEAWQTAYGAYHTCYERYGLAFQTPEAYFDDHRYRSLGYMRPLCVWAIQYALENFQPSLLA
jgi:non-lysosomal glucosylceramidase